MNFMNLSKIESYTASVRTVSLAGSGSAMGLCLRENKNKTSRKSLSSYIPPAKQVARKRDWNKKVHQYRDTDGEKERK